MTAFFRRLNAIALLATVLLLTACGGGGDSPTGTDNPPPPPPPPPPPTAASISVSAGDGQSAEPGQQLAAEPAVIVRSATGVAVPDIAVTFVVDSGGGTITKSTTTTNASGVATAGAWRLGAAEGPQVLVATVASLAPVKIRATARITTTVVSMTPISTSGGTITIDRPGQALDGLKLGIPAGAVTTTTPMSLAVSSTAGMVFKRGIVAVSPALRITGKTGLLKHTAIVRFPSATPTDEDTFLMAYNPATGENTVLPQQARQATAITARLQTLDASMVSRPPSSPLTPSVLARFVSAAADDEEEVFLLLGRIPPESQKKNYEPGFEARRDNWDFTDFAVAWLPFLAGAQEGSPQTEVMHPESGMLSTMLWHFRNYRGGTPLYKRFRLQPDQPRSNKVGIRWTALASADVGPAVAVVIEDLKGIAPGGNTLEDPFSEGDAAFFQWQQLVLLKAQFYSNYDWPQPVLLYQEPNPHAEPEDKQLEPLLGIVTRIVGNEVHILSMHNDAGAYSFTVTRENGLASTTILTLDGEAFTVRSFMPILERPFIDRPAIAANWPKVLDGTVGDAEGWPTLELHWAKGKLDQNSVFIADTLTHHWECPTCPDFGVTIPEAPPNATKPQPFQYGRIVGNAMDALPGKRVFAKTRFRPDSVASDVAPTVTGHHILLPQVEIEPTKYAGGWLDWQTVTYRKVSLRPNPASVAFGRDTTINVTLAPSQPLPAGTTWSWVLRNDKGGRDSVASATPVHARNLVTGTDGYLLIMAHEGTAKRVIAKDSIRIVGTKLSYRITTLEREFQTAINFANCNDWIGGVFNNVFTGATVGFLHVFPSATTTPTDPNRPTPGLYLQVVLPGEADTVSGPPSRLTAAYPLLHRVTASYDGWRPAGSSFSYNGDATSGFITGSAYPLEAMGPKPNGNSDYNIQFGATKIGDLLDGRFHVVNFGLPGDPPRQTCFTTYTFSAMRIR